MTRQARLFAPRPARVLAAAAMAFALFSSGPLAAQEAQREAQEETQSDARSEQAQAYADCMAVARLSPSSGVEQARTWADQGGGDPARHCEGVALLSNGDYAKAGEVLEDLGRTMAESSDPALRANALAQAGQAWLLAGEPERAEAVQSAALDLSPEDVDLWIDRALTRFELGDYRKAIDDLNTAENRGGEQADILTYRASAFRHLDSLGMAEANLMRALELDADHPEALLELGNLNRLQEDREAARQAWMTLLQVAPDSPAAHAARDNLERMDVEVEE